MTLEWSGSKADPQQLATEVYIPAKKGSLQPEMVASARRHGRLAYILEPSLQALLSEVAAGHPAIVLQNLSLSWYPVWHYAVVIGYDLDRHVIFLRSGPDSRRETALSTFEHTWARSGYWALLTLPPDELPRTVHKRSYLAAAMALEQTRQLNAAAAAYRTAIRRWPRNQTARIGLGNTLYAMGDLTGAEATFLQASREHPDSGIIHNNLAQTYADEGKMGLALDAARRAVQLGGPFSSTFHQTLQMIQQRIKAESRHPLP